MGKNVLLVEDNPDNSMLTEKILSLQYNWSLLWVKTYYLLKTILITAC
jgi:hypothetical protein